MIKTIETFTIICDNCGSDICGNEDFVSYTDISYVEDIALDSEWKKMEDKHYCPDCYYLDENDNLIIT
jgi:hypothetical protein